VFNLRVELLYSLGCVLHLLVWLWYVLPGFSGSVAPVFSCVCLFYSGYVQIAYAIMNEGGGEDLASVYPVCGDSIVDCVRMLCVCFCFCFLLL